MKLSIVVITYNMQREARRTLYSLGPAYQRDVAAGDYEVIVIDNNSSAPLDPAMVAGFGPNFRYHFFETSSVSPVEAVNFGAQDARGQALAVIVDGARMASPGLIAQSLAALRAYPNAFVTALAWHLGPDIQPRSIQHGYDQAEEDRLLTTIDWKHDGYQLFAISTIAPSSKHGFLGDFPFECSWFCLPRAMFFELGGFNAEFQTPGGGFCNHEFRDRAVRHPELIPTVLLGEGVFHQVHGGAATNALPHQRPGKRFHAEYQQITGKPFVQHTPPETAFVGTLPEPARRFIQV